MAMPLNEMPNRLDQMRAAATPMPMGAANPPMPMGAANPPSNPMGNIPPSPAPVAGGGGLSAPPPMPEADNARLDQLLGEMGGQEGMLPEEAMMEETSLEIASGLADAAVSLAGSIPAAKAELESALAQLDAMEMSEAGDMEMMV